MGRSRVVAAHTTHARPRVANGLARAANEGRVTDGEGGEVAVSTRAARNAIGRASRSVGSSAMGPITRARAAVAAGHSLTAPKTNAVAPLANPARCRWLNVRCRTRAAVSARAASTRGNRYRPAPSLSLPVIQPGSRLAPLRT